VTRSDSWVKGFDQAILKPPMPVDL
jgi:hypothetical protein